MQRVLGVSLALVLALLVAYFTSPRGRESRTVAAAEEPGRPSTAAAGAGLADPIPLTRPSGTGFTGDLAAIR